MESTSPAGGRVGFVDEMWDAGQGGRGGGQVQVGEYRSRQFSSHPSLPPSLPLSLSPSCVAPNGVGIPGIVVPAEHSQGQLFDPATERSIVGPLKDGLPHGYGVVKDPQYGRMRSALFDNGRLTKRLEGWLPPVPDVAGNKRKRSTVVHYKP